MVRRKRESTVKIVDLDNVTSAPCIIKRFVYQSNAILTNV